MLIWLLLVGYYSSALLVYLGVPFILPIRCWHATNPRLKVKAALVNPSEDLLDRKPPLSKVMKPLDSPRAKRLTSFP